MSGWGRGGGGGVIKNKYIKNAGADVPYLPYILSVNCLCISDSHGLLSLNCLCISDSHSLLSVNCLCISDSHGLLSVNCLCISDSYGLLSVNCALVIVTVYCL